MSIEEGYKRINAEELAAMIGFEWDYENAEDCDLYEALEAMGYTWKGEEYGGNWVAPVTERKLRTRRPRQLDIQERLRQWNAGEKKPGGMGPH